MPQHFHQLLTWLPDKLDALEAGNQGLSFVTLGTQVLLLGLPRPLHLVEHQGAVSQNLQREVTGRPIYTLDTAEQVFQGSDEGLVLCLVVGSILELKPPDLMPASGGGQLIRPVSLRIHAAIIPWDSD